MSNRFKIRFDRHTLGNLVKNVAPAAAFTPLGVVGAGLLGAAGGLARGERGGQVLRSGLSNAAIGAGATSVAGHFGVGPGVHAGFGLGGSSAPPPPVAPTGIDPSVLGTGAEVGASPTVAVPPASGGGLLNAGKGVLKFAEAHPNATAGALSAVGNLASAGSENRLRNAQAATLERKLGESEYDFQRRKANEAAYDNLWSPLGSAIGQGLGGTVAPNPYAPRIG